MERDAQEWKQYETSFLGAGRVAHADISPAEQQSYATDEATEHEQVVSVPEAESEAQLLLDGQSAGEHSYASEVDRYASIRSALRPEHASLRSDELTVVIGGKPALVALLDLLASSEPRRVALAALLGRAGRRSARLNGASVPIPEYLRVLGRLCHESAEQLERGGELHQDRWINPVGESAEQYLSADNEWNESTLSTETSAAEFPFAETALESPVAFEGQVPASVKPAPRSITKDAFFEDEWASPAPSVANPRHVHFNRFTTVTTSGATPQTLKTGNPNPLDPTVTSGLKQPEVIPSRAAGRAESYWVYVPPAYIRAVKAAADHRKELPVAQVSVLFGVGAEVNRHGLRSFFEKKADCILIEVGGIESVPEKTGPWGIGITDAIIADLLTRALGRKVPSKLEVLAAYSTGYRGVNGTINNSLVDLTHLQKMIFFDCLYRADGPKAPGGAPMPPKRHREAPRSAFNTWRAINAVLAASSNCKIIVYDVTPGGTPTYSDKARMVEIPGATFIELKPFNVALKAIILARLMDNGIKDGYFTDAQVPVSIRDLIPLLPVRGTLSSSSSLTSGTIAKWAKDNSTKIAQSIKGFAKAMDLARIHQLMGWATPPGEFGHDGFLPEFGWEHLPV
jgi:hypothetical protein